MANNVNHELIEHENLFNKIFEQFNCSICLNELQNTFMTVKCGHRFCENCIKTCVEEYHKCPLCNHPLQFQDLIRDNHFDSLKDDLKIFKEKKMQAVFDKITSDLPSNNEKQLNPIESVLKNHLIKTLVVHENYSNQLKLNFEKELQRIEENSKQTISQIKKIYLTNEDIETETEKIKKDTQKKIDELNTDYKRQIESIANKYQKYLEQNEMTPYALPAKIKLRLVNKNLKLDGFELKTNDDIKVLFDFLNDTFEKKLNDPIVEIPQDLTILNVGPFSNYSIQEAKELYETFKQNGVLPNSVDLINTKNCIPILEHSIKPESEFLIFGEIKFESGLPKRCFKFTFDKNKPKPIDYYQCQDCLLKWICKFCAEKCHEKHNLRPFSLNHNSNWACCFCERNKCCLQE